MLLPTPPHVETIMLRNELEWAWDMASLKVDSRLNQLVTHNDKSIDKHVLTALGIDVAARIERDELAAGDVPKSSLVDQYRYINKALSMELLVALSLRHLDKPEYVKSLCCVSDPSGHPCHFAPSSFPDLVSRYKTPAGQKNFYILSEVSAMRVMSGEDYRGATGAGAVTCKRYCCSEQKIHCLCPGHQWGLF